MENRITRYDIINNIIAAFKYTRYLEIGYQDGVCYNAVKCDNKIAVDPEPRNMNGNIVVKTSDDFFASNENRFDFIFIDGLHTHQQVKKDLQNAIKCLAPNGLIMLHDMNPSSEERAKSFLDGGMWNGDCYKVAIDIWRGEFKYEYYTINEDNGCLIIDPNSAEKRPDITEFDYSYAFFDSKREEILRLRNIEK